MDIFQAPFLDLLAQSSVQLKGDGNGELLSSSGTGRLSQLNPPLQVPPFQTANRRRVL